MFRKKYLFVVVLLLVQIIDQSEAGGNYFSDFCHFGSNVTEKYKIELRKDSWTRLFLESHRWFKMSFQIVFPLDGVLSNC